MVAKFEMYKDSGGHFRWHVRAANGEVIASSGQQRYNSKAAAEKAIQSIKTSAPDATVVQTTVKQATLPESAELRRRILVSERQRRLREMSRRHRAGSRFRPGL